MDVQSAAPGDVVTYTITVQNSGFTTITGLDLSDDLSGVMDDGTVGGVSADSGNATVDPAAQTLTWTGDLAGGASATITYQVTVDDPVTGDSSLVNSVDSDTPGGPAAPAVTTTPITAPAQFAIASDAWDDGVIAAQYACTSPIDPGSGTSPGVSWADAPEGTVAFAVTIVDTTAGNFRHWTVINIPVATTSFADGASGSIPAPAQELDNDFNEPGYGGPCPPPDGTDHNYVLTVYALDRTIANESEIAAATIASDSLTSTYSSSF
ncbi:YbhB/YbcL family Raf kinase inhibitor-like protein [Saccharothrix sp. NPDC042600]|uniref:YbhB/YbcL family Raf kinase inhibitor-like protein n=1 Tax=Saccharothrix TaxID=2071 RepID=UPI00340EF2E2|nr:hypothetical protein GCM10017745_49730 [Saccharothrix mutabilis subsp. capreolus]